MIRSTTLLVVIVLALGEQCATARAAAVNLAYQKPITAELSYNAIFTGARAVDGQVGDVFNSSYWLAPNASTAGYFVVNLGAPTAIQNLSLRNTHNAHANDRGTGAFEVWASNQIDGAGQLVSPTRIVNGVLSYRSSNVNGDVPLVADVFNATNGLQTGTYQYLRFNATGFAAGKLNAGLNEFYVADDLNVALGKPVIAGSNAYNGVAFNTGAFPTQRVTDGKPNDNQGSQWLTPDGQGGNFILDLGRNYFLDEAALKNTHNAQFNDRGTQGYSISVLANDGQPYGAATAPAGAFTTIASGTLASTAGQGNNITPETVGLGSGVVARYIRFEALSHYGSGAGLNELAVYEGTNIAAGKTVVDGSAAFSYGPGATGAFNTGSFTAQNVTDTLPGDRHPSFGTTSYWLGWNGVTDEFFTIDLEKLFSLQAVGLRNTHNDTFNDRGTQDFTLYGSVDNVTFDLLLSGTLANVVGQGDGIAPEVFAITGDYRYLKFQANTFYGTSAGLNELLAYGQAVPEPGTLLLAGLGLAGLGWVRWRRR